MKSIGERIKEARKSAGLTQLELAKKTELSRSYIGDIEKDRYNPSVSTLQLIATATNTPLEDLLPSTKPVSPTDLPPLTPKDERDIARDLENMIESLDGSAAMGNAEGDEDRELLRASLETAMKIAKRTAKKKFTPKKYQK
ncbi:helix-turn-helix transcriptional regulator [Megasphaera sp.]|uniref:helix-turn-helix transcriptional regulator n=1 Tax=Megasphaera sp. TaxID=2023260 RepID=UPI003AB12166